MFAWGSTAHGELGLGGIEAEHISEPRRLDWFLSDKITDAALGDCHTLFLTNDGTVYSCGSNDHGQLGHTQPRKRPQLVTGLEAHHITRVACGEAHSLALTQWGQILSWGSDSQGQCGHQLDENGVLTTPKIIKAISMYHVVQIACGRRHSVALTNAGEVLTWGENTFGQLGLGSKNNIIRVPTLVQSINGIPIAYITCGGFHTFFLSKSGAVYSCGKNQHGQLGLNHTSDMCYPYQLRTLRNIRVRYICCGDEFSAFLTLDGGVFTCGAGYYGQLGHGTNSNEILPRQVAELMGSTITQISCGRQHTLSFIPSRGRVYSFGLGGAGQLGLSHRKIALTPQVVLGPWASPSGSTLFPTEQQNVMIVKVFAGGDHCFVTVIKRTEDGQPYDCRIYDPSTQILVIEEKKLLDAMKISSSKSVDQELLAYFETVFKSLSCFNGSFLKSQESHYYCCSKNHGIDLEFAETTFSLIGKWEHQGLKDVIWNCIIDGIIGELKPNPPDVETLRVYLTLPLYHEFYNPKHHLRLHKPFAKALLGLNRQPLRVVSTWLESTNPDYFEHLVQKFKTVVSFILSGMTIPSNGTVPYDASLVAMLDMLALLNKLNNGTNGLKVPYETFHLNELGDFLDIRVDYVVWLHESSSSNKLLLCNYPFIFDAQTKTRLLETDQTLQMQNAMHNATQQALMSLIFESMAHRSGTVEVNQFLKLEVSRENIVEDALQELDKVRVEDLKKPLKVKFKGEEAEDAGGVSKEFFMLLLRQILHPNYGMFKEYEETRALWFCSYNFLEEAVHYYMLIGMVVGLAIYNFTIINLPFPLALYKKLLQEPIVLSDLRALSPSIAKSLEQILEYNEPDFQEVYCLDFVVSQDELGEVRTVPLKPNGENIPVTLENKVEYVNAYVDYVLNASVNKQFKAFQIGFMKVMSGRVLRLFHSQELMAVVIGNEHYDWHALEEATKYKNGYKSSDETIRWFWEVIHEMSLEDKKKFLLFLTGSDRIPIQGMKAIQIEIQPTTDEKFLPVAHTCFNLLDLPRYKTKERLRYKLMQAIQQFEGFSLV